MYAGAVIAGLALLLTFVRTDSIRAQAREQLRASDQPVSDQLLDQAVTIGVAVGVVLGLVAIGLWILMAVMNRKGKKWARIVASVLGGLNIAFTLFGFVAGSALGAPVDAVSLVQSLISLGLAVAILALLWQRRSSAYYDAMSRTNTAFG